MGPETAQDGGEPPVGAVLAGGAGRRMGGDKAVVDLEGRPLISYPLEALAAVCPTLAVVAKRGTALPQLVGSTAIWLEPDEPRHPLAGVAHALTRAGSRPVLVCAADLPLVDVATLRALCDAARPGDVAVVPRCGGRLQPLCALYRPAALRALQRFEPGARATDVVAALGPRVVDLADEECFLNVNAPEDLLLAGAALARRRAATRT
jgi:molybdopterin-guanine dinucleotide biosynthesis protein A